MKHILSLFTAIVLLLGLCACGTAGEPAADATTAAPAATFKAGYGKVDITPQDSVPMNGYSSSSERMSTGILSYIYSIAVAVQDADGNIAVVCSVDNAAAGEAICTEVRMWVEEKLGIPMENAMAIGDSGNDESMLRSAGLGVAMGNAPDFIKAAADAVTAACDDDGAARAIEKYCL